MGYKGEIMEDNILGMNRDDIKLLLSQCFLSTVTAVYRADI